MKTSEQLYAAADIIERDGWTQGQSAMCVDGPKCVEGALQAAIGRERIDPATSPLQYDYLSNNEDVYYALRDFLGARFPFAHLFVWNDRIERTQAEVVEVLRAAAVVEAAREAEFESIPARECVPAEATR